MRLCTLMGTQDLCLLLQGRRVCEKGGACGKRHLRGGASHAGWWRWSPKLTRPGAMWGSAQEGGKVVSRCSWIRIIHHVSKVRSFIAASTTALSAYVGTLRWVLTREGEKVLHNITQPAPRIWLK